MAVLNGGKPISEELYQRYADNFRHAVDAVPMSDEDLAVQWRANVSRFAAYKAFHATNELRITAEEEGGDLDMLQAVLHKYNRYQAVEYNTAVSRARTGKQWQEFDDKDNRRLFPCIKWLPSRSATPREEHMPFYNRIWSKDDPFWNTNQPGTLWNCKCDWEQTDEEPTENNPTNNITKPGLDRNPATSGQIFTDTAAYIKKAPKESESICRKTYRNEVAKEGRRVHKNEHITCTIDKTDYELDFSNFRFENNKVDICFHFASSMFGNSSYWLKNDILLHPQRYLKKASFITSADVDIHNVGTTLALKQATDKFFYLKVKLADKKEIILHLGRYKDSQKLYLYSATESLPEYVRNPQ